MHHKIVSAFGGRLEVVIVATVFAAISITAALTQPMERVFADAQIYQSVAEQFYLSQVPIHTQIPGGSRIATPWLVAKLRPTVSRVMPGLTHYVDQAAGLDGLASFMPINVAGSFAATILLLLYLRHFIDNPMVRIILVVAWAMMWHAPVRWVYFYPVNIDALSLASLFGGLLIIETWRDRSPLIAAALLAPVVFVGTLAKETMVLVPIAFGVAQVVAFARERRVERLVAAAIPTLAFGLALLFVRSMLVPAPGHQKWIEIDYILQNKPIWTWVLAWFFTFSPPVIILIVAGWRDVWAFLWSRWDLSVYLVAVAVLGYFAGTGSDTERLLILATPVCLRTGGQSHAHTRCRADSHADHDGYHAGGAHRIEPNPLAHPSRHRQPHGGSDPRAELVCCVGGRRQVSRDRQLLQQSLVVLRQPRGARGHARLRSRAHIVRGLVTA